MPVAARGQVATEPAGPIWESVRVCEKLMRADRFHGTRDLVAIMTEEFGLDLDGTIIREVRGISDDGRTICGTALRDGIERSWVAYLPLLRCPGDVNRDDRLDFYDVQYYLSTFAAGELSADLNSDGVLNFFDVVTYLNRHALGCL